MMSVGWTQDRFGTGRLGGRRGAADMIAKLHAVLVLVLVVLALDGLLAQARAADLFPSGISVPNAAGTLVVGTAPRFDVTVGSLYGGRPTGTLTLFEGDKRLGSTTIAAGLAPARATQIVGGSDFSCAIVSTNVYCWGANNVGQLGDGTRTDRSAPAQVAGITDVTRLTAGAAHVCALKSDKSVACWGTNSLGQLGTGQTFAQLPFSTVPVALNNGNTLAGRIQTIDAGGNHTCVIARINNHNYTYCWGDNRKRQLGILDTGQSSSRPTFVEGFGATEVTRIALGYEHTCAVAAADQAVYCWGSNAVGQLGLGDISATTSQSGINYEAKFIGYTALKGFVRSNASLGSLRITDIVAGDFHTCVVSQSTAACWGFSDQKRLGLSYISFPLNSFMTPVRASLGPVDGPLIGVTSLAASADGTCATRDDGIYCWGANRYDQLALGAGVTESAPVKLTAGPDFANVLKIQLGRFHGCMILFTGLPVCWGLNVNGQVGDATTISRSTPVPMAGFEGLQTVTTILGFPAIPLVATAGTHRYRIGYSGDALHAGTSTAEFDIVATPQTTATFAVPSAPSIAYGDTLTVAVSVSSNNGNNGFGLDGTNRGMVDLIVDGLNYATAMVGADGRVSFPVTGLTVGTHTVQAAFNGTVNYQSSTSITPTVTVTPRPTTVAIATSPSPLAAGATVTITATVTPTAPVTTKPAGDLTFRVNGVDRLTTGLTDGVAVLIVPDLPAGPLAITATYAGETPFSGSTTSRTINLARQTYATTTVMTSSATAIQIGDTVTASVTLDGTGTDAVPTGVIDILDGAVRVGGGALVDGRARVTVAGLGIGDHFLTARYAGDDTDPNIAFQASTSAPR